MKYIEFNTEDFDNSRRSSLKFNLIFALPFNGKGDRTMLRLPLRRTMPQINSRCPTNVSDTPLKTFRTTLIPRSDHLDTSKLKMATSIVIEIAIF